MFHFFSLLWGTLCLRPYVFAFLIAFLAIAIPWLGLKRTLRFWLGTWLIAFISEFSSTRTGFPYGWYTYTQTTKGIELFIADVPFMDSLSYSFLLFASYSMALLAACPLKVSGFSLQIVDDIETRSSTKVTLLTAMFMMMLDVVIDPVALQGEKWFLGQIYGYTEHGYYFGVPLSNAFGWGLVGFVSCFVYQRWDIKFTRSGIRDRGLRRFGMQGWMGPGLYLGVLAFNMAVTAWIKDYALLIADAFIYLMPLALLANRISDLRLRANNEDWARHVKEYKLVA